MSEIHEADDGADISRGDGDGELKRISDVAEEYNVTLRALRFYEDKGLLSPKRVGTSRLYSRRDLVRLQLILRGRRIGFSLREVRQILDLYQSGTPNTRQLKVMLEKGSRQMVRLEQQRDEIAEAIAELDVTLDAVRRELAASNRPG